MNPSGATYSYITGGSSPGFYTYDFHMPTEYLPDGYSYGSGYPSGPHSTDATLRYFLEEASPLLVDVDASHNHKFVQIGVGGKIFGCHSRFNAPVTQYEDLLQQLIPNAYISIHPASIRWGQEIIVNENLDVSCDELSEDVKFSIALQIDVSQNQISVTSDCQSRRNLSKNQKINFKTIKFEISVEGTTKQVEEMQEKVIASQFAENLSNILKEKNPNLSGITVAAPISIDVVLPHTNLTTAKPASTNKPSEEPESGRTESDIRLCLSTVVDEDTHIHGCFRGNYQHGMCAACGFSDRISQASHSSHCILCADENYELNITNHDTCTGNCVPHGLAEMSLLQSQCKSRYACVNTLYGNGNGMCEDSPGWVDADGLSCSWYETHGSLCSDHGDRYKNRGCTASEACCICGGGNKRCIDEHKTFNWMLMLGVFGILSLICLVISAVYGFWWFNKKMRAAVHQVNVIEVGAQPNPNQIELALQVPSYENRNKYGNLDRNIGPLQAEGVEGVQTRNRFQSDQPGNQAAPPRYDNY